MIIQIKYSRSLMRYTKEKQPLWRLKCLSFECMLLLLFNSSLIIYNMTRFYPRNYSVKVCPNLYIKCINKWICHSSEHVFNVTEAFSLLQHLPLYCSRTLRLRLQMKTTFATTEMAKQTINITIPINSECVVCTRKQTNKKDLSIMTLST